MDGFAVLLESLNENGMSSETNPCCRTKALINQQSHMDLVSRASWASSRRLVKRLIPAAKECLQRAWVPSMFRPFWV